MSGPVRGLAAPILVLSLGGAALMAMSGDLASAATGPMLVLCARQPWHWLPRLRLRNLR